MKLLRALGVGLLCLLLGTQAVVGNGGYGPLPGLGAFGNGGGGFVDGVKVGSGGVFARTDTNATVDLTCMSLNGQQFGPVSSGASAGAMWAGYSAVTSAQWAAGLQYWKGTLSTAGQAYGTINCIRVMLGAANWRGLTGISDNGSTSAASQYIFVCNDTNGRPVYTAGTSGGSCGTGPGHEVAGSATVYQNNIKTTVANILGASSTLGYPMYVILDNQWSAVIWNGTGQYVLPIDQPAMPSPADIPMWQDLVALYGNDHRIMFELYNEPFGDNQSPNYPTEAAYLGNGNGTPSTFNFPTTATSPTAPPIGYNYDMGISSGQCIVSCSGSALTPNTAQVASFQQISNAIRTAGGHNVIIEGNLIADERPVDHPANSGTQAYTDAYTVSGIQQTAWALHHYGYTGSETVFTNIQNAGVPIIGTEAGSVVGFGGAGSGYVNWRSHHWGWTWCCWANFAVPPNTNIYPNDGRTWQYNFTILGSAPWYQTNVPVGNTGSDTSQIPTGFNLRPAPPLTRLHGHAANDERFALTGTGMY